MFMSTQASRTVKSLISRLEDTVSFLLVQVCVKVDCCPLHEPSITLQLPGESQHAQNTNTRLFSAILNSAIEGRSSVKELIVPILLD